MPARLRLAMFVAATLVLAGAIGIALFAKPSSDNDSVAFAGAQRPDIPPQDFHLRDQDGKAVSLRQFRGRVVVLTFMYTTCKDTCPLTATQIRGALDDLDHDVPALLIDRHGRQRIGFPVEQLVPEDLAHDIRRLQAEA